EESLVYVPKDLPVLLNLSRCSVYKLIREGRIPSVRLGHRIVIPKKALEKFMMDEAQVEQRAC
ncbi:MAG: helix-turn-helix domain-containing protein, partial [Syntrophorhabdales bacterium]